MPAEVVTFQIWIPLDLYADSELPSNRHSAVAPNLENFSMDKDTPEDFTFSKLSDLKLPVTFRM